MKRFPFLSAFFLLSCMFAWAQTDDPGCYFTAYVQDTGCGTSGSNCANPTGCSSQTFHVQCAGVIRFKAGVTCTSGECDDCAVCVRIVEQGGEGQEYHAFSTYGSCSRGACCTMSSENLPVGDYILYACLIPCPTGGSCCTGGSSCEAWAIASSDPISNCP